MYPTTLLAGNGVDYDSGPYQVTFPAWTTTAKLEIEIYDDGVSEDSESFQLVIDRSSLPSEVTVGRPRRATVNILD